ncbi:MAG: ComEA family DNA-binding protein [Peptostreptococcaceae bacterium]|nr:ComEA family DNA-binding protein [Peptostreptococcaceae bacterium]
MSSKLSYNKKSLQKTAIISLVLIAVMTLGQFYARTRRYEIPSKAASEDVTAADQEIPFSETSGTQKPPAQIVVHIVGEVNAPSVITLDKGSRLYQAVEKAGGFTPNADRNGINLAQELLDGSQYIIPKVGEKLIIHKNDGSQTSGVASVNDGKIDINRATKDELKKLPGVGDVLAERIIAYRQKNGDFKNISQLLDVEGIGRSKFDSMKDAIFVG